MRVDLRHLQIVGEPQRFGNAGGAGAADVLRGDDLDRGGGLQEPLGLLGDGRHLDVHQLLDAQALELASRGGLRRRVGVRLPGLPEQEARQQACNARRAVHDGRSIARAGGKSVPCQVPGHGLPPARSAHPSGRRQCADRARPVVARAPRARVARYVRSEFPAADYVTCDRGSRGRSVTRVSGGRGLEDQQRGRGRGVQPALGVPKARMTPGR